jgi:Tripartite tricarboxylate transporter family receptor
MSRGATAQPYPTRPVHVIVPYPPGGGADLLARMISQWLSERLGQQFVVENRPGAAGNLGTESVARARADGYTLLLAVSPNAINASLYDNLNFNFIRDIAPVAALIRVIAMLSDSAASCVPRRADGPRRGRGYRSHTASRRSRLRRRERPGKRKDHRRQRVRFCAFRRYVRLNARALPVCGGRLGCATVVRKLSCCYNRE